MAKTNRREFLNAASMGGGVLAALSALGVGAAQAENAPGRSGKLLRAAFSNSGLQSTWCAQGKAAASYWSKLFNVELTWFDGELDPVKQRTAVENMAEQKWDFVAIQANIVGTLTSPVRKMIDAGIPVIAMDSLIAPSNEIRVYSQLGANNKAMAAVITQALITKLGGNGKIIMTAGPLDNTAAQDRTKGFKSVVEGYPNIEVLATDPGDWDVTKVSQLWEGYLAKYPRIDGAIFHSDDMALAAYDVIKKHERTSILLGGIDAMPPAIDAVYEGRMFATIRNPACLIHGAAVMIGVAAATSMGNGGVVIPQRLFTDGPLVTLETAESIRWLESQFLV